MAPKSAGDAALPLSALPDGVALAVKVVPGASRTRVMGLLGERLKVAVAAPPEAGKANKALCQLLAELFAVSPGQVQVAAGQSQPQKTVVILGIKLCDAGARLSKLLTAAKGK